MLGLPLGILTFVFGSLMGQIFPIRKPEATIGIQEDLNVSPNHDRQAEPISLTAFGCHAWFVRHRLDKEMERLNEHLFFA